ncbi:interferon-induced protein 44-like isoform X2 [Seriola aureovittata]|uniref:interferon-induced protein 44-like isoform X2 n=1 Tax=Seriola aureovittata TaxID=2871759 RepID=UPI0024BE97A0|nr:interferon-induced protein 44-like isoform X2 [Seriola aureovittata]
MGAENSKSQPPILSQPWREINWQDKQTDLQFVKNYKPQVKGQQLRILLHGPVGAGKSSFINSVQSVLQGRMYIQALADNISHDSFTKKYTTYKIQKESPNTFYPFVFNNIMGLGPNKGVLVDDVKLALKGHIKDGYLFNPVSQISEDHAFYKTFPELNDKVHVLVLVICADTLPLLTDKFVKELLEIRKAASDLGIPQVALLTKIDQACPEVKEDLKNVYKYEYIKKQMEKLSAEVGIPMNCIFPVKNYHEEIHVDNDTDALLLSSLRSIITCGDDYINFTKQQTSSDRYA